MLYLAELLSYFAEDGAKDAEQVLWSKYEILYKGLMARKRSPQGTFCEKDDFDMLCQVLGEDENSFLKIFSILLLRQECQEIFSPHH